jgi:acyl carrier protein
VLPTVRDVEDVIIKALAADQAVTPTELRAQLTCGGDDLPIDSLALAEVLVKVEEELDVKVPETADSARSMRSVASLARLLVGLLTEAEERSHD